MKTCVGNVIAYIYEDAVIRQGYKLGSLDIEGAVVVIFIEENPLPKMRAVRDELSRQIAEIEVASYLALHKATADPASTPAVDDSGVKP